MKSKFKRYELTITTENKEYVDMLIVSLSRAGFAPYISCVDERHIIIEIDSTMLREIKER